MSLTPEDSSLPSRNATASAETSEELPHNESSSVNSTSSDTSEKVLEDPSIVTENDTVDKAPALKKRKPRRIVEEENNDSKQKQSIYNSDESVEFPDFDVGRISNIKNSDTSFSSTTTTQEESSSVSEDAKLINIVAELSTSDESFSNSKLGDLSKLEDLLKEESKMEPSSKSEDSNTEDSSKSEDSNTEDSSKSEDSNTEDSSKSKDSSMEDLKTEESHSNTDDSSFYNYTANTAADQSSEEAESDLSQKGNSNKNCHFRKEKPSNCEDKESSDSDKETSSSGYTPKDSVGPNKSKKQSGARLSHSEFFPQTSEDSSKSRDSSSKSRDESLEDTESCVPGEDDTKNVPPIRKRKLSTIGEATEDADGEYETSSSNDDSHSSIKRPQKIYKNA